MNTMQISLLFFEIFYCMSNAIHTSTRIYYTRKKTLLSEHILSKQTIQITIEKKNSKKATQFGFLYSTGESKIKFGLTKKCVTIIKNSKNINTERILSEILFVFIIFLLTNLSQSLSNILSCSHINLIL